MRVMLRAVDVQVVWFGEGRVLGYGAGGGNVGTVI